ncbi:asparagine synthase (glutamine-hydrolyzing) [Ramlibacter sp. AN1133]|uniref:asparagine synthase (glutamine-hydrolyzing) n=1 Tax=Ramlibacter sp. AN1133 TaxID=3133429 RepID=UPI0030C396FE
MCGITGYFRVSPSETSATGLALVRRMADALVHRGPDSAGYWHNSTGTVALGHRRLSILDLSEAGAQPMQSASGRYQIAFNGEIYNHQQLRTRLERELRAPQWRGHSDTETLLAAFECWGIEATLTMTVGMFAMALWDKQEQTLYLARDRFGEKPLYYGWAAGAPDGCFVFGSELKALRAFPGFTNAVCREAVAQYMRFMYVPAPLSIFEGVYKLEPGCLLAVRGMPPGRPPPRPITETEPHGSVTVHRWWSLADAAAAGMSDPLTDEADALDRLDTQLQEAVRLQSLSDVPLGAFLSGGVDSSTIAAMLQEQAHTPIKTFTVGFEEADYDESQHARAVARHLGTEHHELFVTAAEARAVIPLLPAMFDEPFADSSQIPTHLVCRAARQHVTVALSGDAGDELFGGYNRYFWGPRIWSRVRFVPSRLRDALMAGVHRAAPGTWNRWLLRSGVVRPGEKLHKLANALHGAQSINDLYANLATEWHRERHLVYGVHAAQTSFPALPAPSSHAGGEAASRMMFWDAMTYLPDDILCKVDRAAMATSLETRVPFLDHRVAELAWRLPVSLKIRGNHGKWALRQVLYRRVPRELIERPKTGFSIPVGQWLVGPLREWAEHLLDEQRLRRDGFLDPVPVRRAWKEHLSGAYDRSGRLWAVLMFQAWLDSTFAR